jgi:hypothetical protein
MFQPVAFTFGSSLPQKEASMAKAARENQRKSRVNPEKSSEKPEKTEPTPSLHLMRFCSLIQQQPFVSSEPSTKGALRYAEKIRENLEH